jgi:hypothetical protein
MDGRILESNQAALRVAGTSYEATIGQFFWEGDETLQQRTSRAICSSVRSSNAAGSTTLSMSTSLTPQARKAATVAASFVAQVQFYAASRA